MSYFIKVWCEYDINGDFGGNNDEAVLDATNVEDIESAVLGYLKDQTGLCEEELEDLYGWESIYIEKLKEA